jgi:hypothetical protein
MSELVHERRVDLVDADGIVYDRAFIYGELQPAHVWRGFIEFVSADGEDVIRTGQETTQLGLEDLADWASGLEAVYFEGAFERALHREHPEQDLVEPVAAEEGIANDLTGRASDVVHLSIETADPELPMRLMASRTLVPGLRRRVVPGGDLAYTGSSTEGSDAGGVYDFVAEISTVAGADLVADVLFSELEDTDAVIVADGVEIPTRRRAIKDALLGVPVG